VGFYVETSSLTEASNEAIREGQRRFPGRGVEIRVVEKLRFPIPPEAGGSSAAGRFWQRWTRQVSVPLSLHVELQKKSILELKAVSLYAALVTSLYFASPQKSPESRSNELIAG
jgi:hypothetical protein